MLASTHPKADELARLGSVVHPARLPVVRILVVQVGLDQFKLEHPPSGSGPKHCPKRQRLCWPWIGVVVGDRVDHVSESVLDAHAFTGVREVAQIQLEDLNTQAAVVGRAGIGNSHQDVFTCCNRRAFWEDVAELGQSLVSCRTRIHRYQPPCRRRCRSRRTRSRSHHPVNCMGCSGFR